MGFRIGGTQMSSDGSGEVGPVDGWRCGSQTAGDSAIDHNEIGFGAAVKKNRLEAQSRRWR